MKINYLATLLIATFGIAANVLAARPGVPVNVNNSPTDTVANQITSEAVDDAKSKTSPITTQGGTSICTQRQISSYYINTYEYKKACFSNFIAR